MILYIILAVIGLFVLIALSVGYFLSAPGYDGTSSDHFNGKRFLNPDNVEAKGFADVLKWGLNREQGSWTMNYETFMGKVPEKPTDSTIKITFVNHSTFLIQTRDLAILTDPVWSDRASPFRIAGPKRYRPPGILFEDLPKIDLVLLSHNHYDHLDLPTIKRLETDHQPLFIVPLGVAAFLSDYISNIKETDWWESMEYMTSTIHSVPAIHFSGRGMFDRDKTLWSGYVLELNKKKIYFAGDTGYGGVFKKIGDRFSSIDVSLIPIGAYKPKWFMSPIHISPEEAVKVHQDVNSKQSIAIHFGTFALADEGQGQAETDLQKAMNSRNIPKNQFMVPEEGETILF